MNGATPDSMASSMVRFLLWLGLILLACFTAGVSTGCGNREASVDSLTAPIASPSPTPTPAADPGVTDLERIKPGVEAPDFLLTDQDGGEHRLSDLRGKKRVVLVFYRTFMCTQCVGQLGRLKSLLTDAEKKDIQILAISADTRDETQNTLIEMSKYPGRADYPLLEDRNHRVIDRYGIHNPAEFKPGIPFPAVYIIDKNGIVTDRYLDAAEYSRASNEWIREALKINQR